VTANGRRARRPSFLALRGMRTTSAALAAFASGQLLVWIAEAVNPGWSPVEQMVSHYVHGTAGWLIPTATVLFGAGSMLVTAAVARTDGSSRAGTWLLGGWCALFFVAAAFPADPPGRWEEPPSGSGMVHGCAALTAFALLPVAAVLVTRRVRPGPRALVLAAAASVVATAFFAVVFVDVTDGPSLTFGGYESLTGLAERLLLWADLIWLGTVCVVLRGGCSRAVPA